MGYRILDHTADIGVEVDGATRSDLFREGAAALLALLTDRAAILASIAREIRVEGADLTDLWINYLREVLYLFNGEGFLVREAGELNFSGEAMWPPSPEEARAADFKPAGDRGRCGSEELAAAAGSGRHPEEKAPLGATFINGDGSELAAGRSITDGSIPDAAAASKDRAAPGGGSDTAVLCLTVRCLGEYCDPRRHTIETEIKAVTYHRAAVEKTPTGWRGIFIVDV